MAERGTDLSAWNWKTKEIDDGKLPPDEDTMIKNPINLSLELSRVDAELADEYDVPLIRVPPDVAFTKFVVVVLPLI